MVLRLAQILQYKGVKALYGFILGLKTTFLVAESNA